MSEERDNMLQSIFRCYLFKLHGKADKYGLGCWFDKTLERNLNGECSPTEEECDMLARLCDDDRITRDEIPNVIGKSYRKCCSDGDFNKVRKLKRNGEYSKISALLLKNDTKKG